MLNTSLGAGWLSAVEGPRRWRLATNPALLHVPRLTFSVDERSHQSPAAVSITNDRVHVFCMRPVSAEQRASPRQTKTLDSVA